MFDLDNIFISFYSYISTFKKGENVYEKTRS